MKLFIPILGIALFAGAILAEPIKIDFTKDYYESLINNKKQTDWFSVEGNPSLEVRVTETKGGTLKWAEKGKSIPGYDSDGIGVDDDEIREAGQEIKIEFNQMVNLQGIELLDLFYEKNNERQTSEVTDGYFEVGYYEANGTLVPFYALNQDYSLIGSQSTSPGLYGQLIKDIPDLMINEIIFSSYDQPLRGDNDYALASLSVSAVPEPNEIALISLSLLLLTGMFIVRRKDGKIIKVIN